MKLFALMILAIAVIFLLAPNGSTMEEEGPNLAELEHNFVDAWNGWMTDTKHLSLLSPDYSTRVAESWQKRDLGNKFRRLERAVRWWAGEEKGIDK